MKHVMKGAVARRALLLVAPAIVGALVWGGVASGTPPAGVSSKTTLADVTVLDTVKADVPPLIKFRTTDQVEVAQFSNTAQPADPTARPGSWEPGRWEPNGSAQMPSDRREDTLTCLPDTRHAIPRRSEGESARDQKMYRRNQGGAHKWSTIPQTLQSHKRSRA